jgi:HSP20 family molecular chaperone IbpA
MIASVSDGRFQQRDGRVILVMLMKKREGEVVPRGWPRDPFALFRQMTADFDQRFAEPFLRWPAFRTRPMGESTTYFPEIDVFERDNRLVTKIDLPGMNKEDVKVEINDGRLVISGERKTEAEEKKEGSTAASAATAASIARFRCPTARASKT